MDFQRSLYWNSSSKFGIFSAAIWYILYVFAIRFSPFAQFNGKLAHNQQPNPSQSSFLDSFSGLKSQSMQQGGMLGQLTDLSSKQSALSSYSQVFVSFLIYPYFA